MSHWLLHYHSEFERHFERWLFADDHMRQNVFSGADDLDVIDSLVPQDFRTEIFAEHKRLKNIDRTYLIQKDQGELDPAYDERKEISSYTPYYPFAVASLVGMFFDAQDDLTPTWQPEDAQDGLGGPDEDDTIADKLEDDFDGRGNNFVTHLWNVSVNKVTMGQTWGVVEGIKRNEEGEKIGEAAVRQYAPMQMENWLSQDERLVEAKLRIEVDTRDSLADIDGDEDEVRHVVYDTDGWREFSLLHNEQGNIEGKVENEDSYTYYATEERRKRILPVVRSRLPLRGNPGYGAARQANTIFNLESALDFELWYSSFAKFIMDVATEDGINEDLSDDVKSGMKDGDTVLPGGDHKYITPPTDNASMKQDRIEKKVRQFFKTFFHTFGDAAKEKTATEVRQEARSGVTAFLTTLAHGLENYVNSVLWRLEQVYFPDRPQLWGQATWTATKDFDPVDIDERVDEMVKRFFPAGKVPLTESTAKEIIIRWHETNDLEVPDEAEMETAVENLIGRREQAQSAARDFGLEA